MEIVKCFEHLLHKYTCCILWYGAIFDNELEQFTTGNKLENQIELILGVDHLLDLDDVQVIDLLQNVHLFHEDIAFADRLHFVLLDDLDGKLRTSRLVLAQLDLGKSTRAQGSGDVVLGGHIRMLSLHFTDLGLVAKGDLLDPFACLNEGDLMFTVQTEPIALAELLVVHIGAVCASVLNEDQMFTTDRIDLMLKIGMIAAYHWALQHDSILLTATNGHLVLSQRVAGNGRHQRSEFRPGGVLLRCILLLCVAVQGLSGYSGVGHLGSG
mmetsp:Transcript_8336/g.21025  ORF Transcript_8336/g.21025 Transcript_8336/m.21025 type:complete len:269 (-) Transcript_8336:20-826(-)